MTVVLLFLAILPTFCLLAAMAIRSFEPRSSYTAPKDKGRWSLSPDSPLHDKSHYRGR